MKETRPKDIQLSAEHDCPRIPPDLMDWAWIYFYEKV
jgi:hypothetical protein